VLGRTAFTQTDRHRSTPPREPLTLTQSMTRRTKGSLRQLHNTFQVYRTSGKADNKPSPLCTTFSTKCLPCLRPLLSGMKDFPFVRNTTNAMCCCRCQQSGHRVHLTLCVGTARGYVPTALQHTTDGALFSWTKRTFRKIGSRTVFPSWMPERSSYKTNVRSKLSHAPGLSRQQGADSGNMPTHLPATAPTSAPRLKTSQLPQ
jgi:hypothetical protein